MNNLRERLDEVDPRDIFLLQNQKLHQHSPFKIVKGQLHFKIDEYQQYADILRSSGDLNFKDYLLTAQERLNKKYNKKQNQEIQVDCSQLYEENSQNEDEQFLVTDSTQPMLLNKKSTENIGVSHKIEGNTLLVNIQKPDNGKVLNDKWYSKRAITPKPIHENSQNDKQHVKRSVTPKPVADNQQSDKQHVKRAVTPIPVAEPQQKHESLNSIQSVKLDQKQEASPDPQTEQDFSHQNSTLDKFKNSQESVKRSIISKHNQNITILETFANFDSTCDEANQNSVEKVLSSSTVDNEHGSSFAMRHSSLPPQVEVSKQTQMSSQGSIKIQNFDTSFHNLGDQSPTQNQEISTRRIQNGEKPPANFAVDNNLSQSFIESTGKNSKQQTQQRRNISLLTSKNQQSQKQKSRQRFNCVRTSLQQLAMNNAAQYSRELKQKVGNMNCTNQGSLVQSRKSVYQLKNRNPLILLDEQSDLFDEADDQSQNNTFIPRASTVLQSHPTRAIDPKYLSPQMNQGFGNGYAYPRRGSTGYFIDDQNEGCGVEVQSTIRNTQLWLDKIKQKGRIIATQQRQRTPMF